MMYHLLHYFCSLLPPLRAVRQQEGHPADRDLAGVGAERPLPDDHRRQVPRGRRRTRLCPQRE